jgi:hypothetical protein
MLLDQNGKFVAEPSQALLFVSIDCAAKRLIDFLDGETEGWSVIPVKKPFIAGKS